MWRGLTSAVLFPERRDISCFHWVRCNEPVNNGREHLPPLPPTLCALSHDASVDNEDAHKALRLISRHIKQWTERPENSNDFFSPFCPLERLLAVRWIIAVHLIATLLSALRRYDKTRLQKETSLLGFYANVPRRHHYENIFVSLNISPLRPNTTFVISIHSACLGTYHILLTQMQRELLRYDCSILQKNFVDSLRKEKVKV